MQGFYWNSPPGGLWYDSLAKLAPRLASAGISAIWFPSPAKGAGGGFSMGYDPYDHYDFGDYFQKGSKETRFGSKQELINAISTFHSVGIQVYADAVMRHMMGGETRAPYECIPLNNGTQIVADSAFMVFNYPNGSGRFKKSPAEFYPNSEHCFVDPKFVETDPLFRFGEWLDHGKQSVRDSLIAWGKYLRNDLKFDGFRLDAVKPIDPAFMAAFLKAANGTNYAVAELWSSSADIGNWLNVAKNQNGATVAMFDFPLRYTLKEMCNNTSGGFDMRTLDNAGLAGAGISGFDYSTFVENHDFDRTGFDGNTDNGHDPILTDKHLAYAYILFSEGRPCIFFKDYFTYGYSGKIDTLIWIRQNFLGGGTTKRGGLNAFYIREDNNQDQNVVGPDVYVARRDGFGGQKGGYIVINDNPTQWIDVWVDTELPVGTAFKDFTGKDANKFVVGPAPGGTKNRVKLWSPARSYTLFVADTATSLNNPPVLNRIPDQLTYTNAIFEYRSVASDVNKLTLQYTLSNNPTWLSVDASGTLSGIPSFSDTGSVQIILSVKDPANAADADTFIVTVKRNVAPKIVQSSDTTAVATKRFERTITASDDAVDLPLTFSLRARPNWLSIGSNTGIISGTPAQEDTGSTSVTILVADLKGGFDSTKFLLTVKPVKDSVITTYQRPKIDGTISFVDDWSNSMIVATDKDSDSVWWDKLVGPPNNELYKLLVTWDADSLYLGVDYLLNDKNNSLMLYVDAIPGKGITNFISTGAYKGDYPKNNRLRTDHGIDLFVASYNQDQPSVFLSDSNQSVNITAKSSHVRGIGGRGLEVSLGWNDLYHLGNGLVPKNASLFLVALASGGYDYGSGDAMPDNPDVDGNGGPDSLINLASVQVDKNGDGIPDPTIFLTEVKKENTKNHVPGEFTLEQNFPNPFNPTTTIRFSVPSTLRTNSEGALITLNIYDILGRNTAAILNGRYQPGTYSVSWNASGFTSGIYFYTLKSDDFISTKKLLLLK
ncbi:MAG: putative Ig domain-containing protein [Bacteroidota bacterium]